MTDYTAPYPTKKAFIEDVKAGRNVTLVADVTGRTHLLKLRDIELNVGKSYTVTNKRRSWFASVTIGENRKVIVK